MSETLGPRFWAKLWSIDLISAGACVILRHEGLRILVYHDLVDVDRSSDPLRLTVSPSLFERHIAQLRDDDVAILSLDEAVAKLGDRHLPSRAAVITFDDGYLSFLTEAVPILRRYGAPATLFVTAGYLDTPRFAFNRVGPFTRPLTWHELAEVAAVPGIDIGSHTMTHPRLHELTSAERRDELGRSRDMLQSHLGRPVRNFAYPFGGWGTFPPDVQDDVRAAGYAVACANVMGSNQTGANVFALRRVRLGWEDARWRFRRKIAGAYDWSDQMRRLAATA